MGWFTGLSRKNQDLMHELFIANEDDSKGIVPMEIPQGKEHCQFMRELGFGYDPSMAGSSVRFKPPNGRDSPITFHMPHPDPTMQLILLKQFAKRSKEDLRMDFVRQSEGNNVTRLTSPVPSKFVQSAPIFLSFSDGLEHVAIS
ncbi:hypothetical protein C0995_001212 [Termitomyces sp. Mi166|nr:hypothetical protein C0995_001212 [Termitomyces sp. Mi166\